MPCIAGGLSFVVLRRGGLLDADRGLLRGLPLGGGGLFGRLGGSLMGGRFGSLLPRFGGSAHAAGSTVVRAVGDGWQARNEHSARAERGGGGPVAQRTGG